MGVKKMNKTLSISIFILFSFITAVLIGNIVHEQYHIHQLSKVDITPIRVCYLGIADYQNRSSQGISWVCLLYTSPSPRD